MLKEQGFRCEELCVFRKGMSVTTKESRILPKPSLLCLYEGHSCDQLGKEKSAQALHLHKSLL